MGEEAAIIPDYVPLIAEDVQQEIAATLRRIEQEQDVDILFAVESGSRAWGFPSPDSDYDVRFVYRHRLDWYLSLKPGRDVIELPISDELDVSGWDIRKALNLLMKPNPTLLEWLASPVRYLWRDEADELAAFARKIGAGQACQQHYLSLGRNSWRKALTPEGAVRYKKLFYGLRPAMALRWMALHPGKHPPMNFQALCQGCDLPRPLLEAVRDLLFLKSRAGEQKSGPRLPIVEHFVEGEFARAEAMPGQKLDEDFYDQAEALFRRMVKAGSV